ncbi:MAG TPA: MmcQ/YjbR family DNA-binding protein [Aggregatilinea sp.]|uniref:MmcQ/YjbR family DNA-binding protein n=1 Tax=Aggregatilinea sp. TaxID=2806333 RepID=UPI002D0A8593|nr:MmcQ/YjbR family DNA-binding protein [Aggregatilinea sp.]HML22921.1 MmcQ/YjbR family DNA-binding protein [Aggregatilinea sp.]
MATEVSQISEALRAFALDLPGAFEDFPWGERVIKVNKKIFVFLGAKEGERTELYLGVKLPESAEDVLILPFAEPMGYNLGKSGWVEFHFPPGTIPPACFVQPWIVESYRAVAPKAMGAKVRLP